jgi:hypothetical protein
MSVEELKEKAEKLKNELTNALSLGLHLALGSDERHNDLMKDINELAAAFHEEGVAEERERIKRVSLRHEGGGYAETYGEPWYLVRERTLTPPKELKAMQLDGETA